jgi:glycosyltransferase involved in cell wall biosynthesis
MKPRIGVIIPACNEEECIGRVLAELLDVLETDRYAIAVGVNSSSDRTAEVARQFPVVVAETTARGYGYGCQAAIDALNAVEPGVRAYVFFAGDGASAPRDIFALAHAYEEGSDFVLGARTKRIGNWSVMGASHVLANISLGLWCGLLTGRWFADLAPLRLIDRGLFERIAPREMTFGWTIEPQIAAALMGANILEISASERPRMAGQQKVSGVTWRRTFVIGCRILAAGWRARGRFRGRYPVRARGAVAPARS